MSEEFPQIVLSQMAGEAIVFFFFFLTKDYTARSTFPKGFSAEFQCQGILISAIDRHTHYSLIKQCFKHSTTHTSPHEDARTAHTPHNEF